MPNEAKNIPQNIILQDRSKTTVSGVLDVISMEDETVELKTVQGRLIICGRNMRIVSFSTQTGDLFLQGNAINKIEYLNEGENKGSLLSRIFK